jgi:hypothetical protein
VTAAPAERLPDAVEAAAYFVVSECLANVGKHAQATSATVSVTTTGDHLTVVVADDGVGGADLDGGSGVQGLMDRVGALSGWLSMGSPPGEGTTVTATIPLSGEAETRPRVLSVTEAEALQGERLHHLKLRAASIGIVAAVLVGIWALTGPDKPWIVWPLLALGLVAALDAWRVLAMPPISDADLGDAGSAATTGGEDALGQLIRRRHLRHSAGGLAILNLFLIGIWLASGSDYFWPAWVILGSLAAIGLKALPRPARSRIRSAVPGA